MWYLGLLLGLLALSGTVMADVEEEIKRCVEDVDEKKLDKILKDSEEEQLTIVCPEILGLLECIDKAIARNTGLTVAEIAVIAPEPEVLRLATIFGNIKDVFTELCTDDTRLNKAYKRNAICLENMNVDFESCEEAAAGTYEAYKGFENRVQEEAGDDVDDDNRQCMVVAYKSACVASQIYDMCGRDAFKVYQTLIKRSSIFKMGLCSKEDLDELKTEFLDSIDMDERQKNVFRLAFNLRKRRK